MQPASGLEMAMRQQQLQNAIQNIAQQQAAMAMQQHQGRG
jgi:hypothetical protein